MAITTSLYRNAFQRVLVSAVALPVVITLITWHAWGYFALFFLILGMTLKEFYALVKQMNIHLLTTWGIGLGVLLYTLIFLIVQKINLEACLLGFFVALLLPYGQILYQKKNQQPLHTMAYLVLGMVYIALPFSLYHYIAFFQGIYQPKLVLSVLFLVWAHDSGAYFAGLNFGQHKLFPRISPKKTWEGVLGGVLCTWAVGYGLYYWIAQFSLLYWWMLSTVVVVASIYGDLVASLLKRTIGVKDASQAIPGHGGFLDRMDSLLFAIPCVAAFLYIIDLW